MDLYDIGIRFPGVCTAGAIVSVDHDDDASVAATRLGAGKVKIG